MWHVEQDMQSLLGRQAKVQGVAQPHGLKLMLEHVMTWTYGRVVSAAKEATAESSGLRALNQCSL